MIRPVDGSMTEREIGASLQGRRCVRAHVVRDVVGEDAVQPRRAQPDGVIKALAAD